MTPDPPTHRLQARVATGALLLTTIAWGIGFVWAKGLGAAANEAAGKEPGAPLGPIVILTLRFGLAAAIWFAVVPAARRGWSKRSFRNASVLGGLMAVGLALQHLGLDRSDEATVAFITNLTVVFVPLIVAVAYLRVPSLSVCVALVLATVGIYLLAGGRTGRLGVGEWLTLGSAIVFSFALIVIDYVCKRDSAARMTGGLFISVTLVCGATALLLGGGRVFADETFRRTLFTSTSLWNLFMLAGFTTVFAFGLMNYFQPKLDPTRAAIIYLFEPIFAALFMWLIRDEVMTRIALVGAALILIANVIAEAKFFKPRSRRDTSHSA